MKRCRNPNTLNTKPLKPKPYLIPRTSHVLNEPSPTLFNVLRCKLFQHLPTFPPTHTQTNKQAHQQHHGRLLSRQNPFRFVYEHRMFRCNGEISSIMAVFVKTATSRPSRFVSKCPRGPQQKDINSNITGVSPFNTNNPKRPPWRSSISSIMTLLLCKNGTSAESLQSHIQTRSRSSAAISGASAMPACGTGMGGGTYLAGLSWQETPLLICLAKWPDTNPMLAMRKLQDCTLEANLCIWPWLGWVCSNVPRAGKNLLLNRTGQLLLDELDLNTRVVQELTNSGFEVLHLTVVREIQKHGHGWWKSCRNPGLSLKSLRGGLRPRKWILRLQPPSLLEARTCQCHTSQPAQGAFAALGCLLALCHHLLVCPPHAEVPAALPQVSGHTWFLACGFHTAFGQASPVGCTCCHPTSLRCTEP